MMYIFTVLVYLDYLVVLKYWQLMRFASVLCLSSEPWPTHALFPDKEWPEKKINKRHPSYSTQHKVKALFQPSSYAEV